MSSEGYCAQHALRRYECGRHGVELRHRVNASRTPYPNYVREEREEGRPRRQGKAKQSDDNEAGITCKTLSRKSCVLYLYTRSGLRLASLVTRENDWRV